MRRLIIPFVVSLILVLSFSCRKDKVLTDSSASLNFSTDTLLFDTVFTTIGSTTKRIKVYNRNKKKVVISSIRVRQGSNSQFRINVDGASGLTHSNIEIEPEDSLFIFVEVTVDPNSVLSPFVVEDGIDFLLNGNTQTIGLIAWGQNAHYFTPKVFSTSLPPYSCLDGDCSTPTIPINTTWVNDKPYVIYGYLVIDSLDVLNIDPGVRVHFYNNSGLWVYKDGTLKVNGTADERVVFQGTRLEYAYQDVSGQWDRIWINEGSVDNVINYAVIKNAFIGIQVEPLPFNLTPTISANALRLNNTIIHNSLITGIFARNYNIISVNSVISNSGQYNFFAMGGGFYEFNQTTFANYWSDSKRETPSVYIQDYYTDLGGTTVVGLPTANFNNSIIHGDLENEFTTKILSSGSVDFNFDYCILKTTNSTTGANYTNVIANPSAAIFNDISLHDYHLTSGSPAIDAGNPALGITLDQDGVIRSSPPDMGAYEY